MYHILIVRYTVEDNKRIGNKRANMQMQSCNSNAIVMRNCYLIKQ